MSWKMNDDNFGEVPLSLLYKWVVEEKLTDMEIGNRVRGYYWDNVSELRQGK